MEPSQRQDKATNSTQVGKCKQREERLPLKDETEAFQECPCGRFRADKGEPSPCHVLALSIVNTLLRRWS